MTAPCWLCGRPRRVPSADGLGPICRRKLHPPHPKPTARTDPAGLETTGQLTIPTATKETP